MIRILQTSDLHLDAVFPELDGFAAARRADQMETFGRIVECAIRQKVHLLVVAGDLFASPWPSDDVVAPCETDFSVCAIMAFFLLCCREAAIRPAVPTAFSTGRCLREPWFLTLMARSV